VLRIPTVWLISDSKKEKVLGIFYTQMKGYDSSKELKIEESRRKEVFVLIEML
jgi:hypothetical protein